MTGLTSDGSTLYAATREGEVAVSTDGVSWSWQGSISQLSVMALGTDTPPIAAVELPPRPHLFSVGQDYPNPFDAGAGVTYLPFELKRRSFLELRVYDAAGRLVRTLLEREMSAESHRVSWDGEDEEAALGPLRYISIN